MPFEQPKFEQRPEAEEGSEKLESFIESTALELREEGIPVNEKCRIDMDLFKGVYPEPVLEKDKKTVKELRKKWYGEMAEQMESEGDELEMLKTAIFQKNLGAEFIIARSSYYDDIKGGVDNVILEKKTGNLVCALDEVGDISGERYEEKKNKVLGRNVRESGASLKYGFVMERRREKMELKLGRVENLPIFYLALPNSYLEEGLKSFQPSPTESSPYEKKLFAYFIASMNSQVKELKLARRPLHPGLRERLNVFENLLRGLT